MKALESRPQGFAIKKVMNAHQIEIPSILPYGETTFKQVVQTQLDKAARTNSKSERRLARETSRLRDSVTAILNPEPVFNPNNMDHQRLRSKYGEFGVGVMLVQNTPAGSEFQAGVEYTAREVIDRASKAKDGRTLLVQLAEQRAARNRESLLGEGKPREVSK